jgi:dihydroceramidase
MYRHLLTGIAEYYNIVWSTYLRYCFQGRQDEVDLVWPTLWTMPYVERKTQQKKIQ